MKLFDAKKVQQPTQTTNTRRQVKQKMPKYPTIDYSLFSESEKDVAALIYRRRLQVLVHSCIYYLLDTNLIPDKTFDYFSNDLARLQNEYPKIAERICYADVFRGWIGGSGAFLPYADAWVLSKAKHLIELEAK